MAIWDDIKYIMDGFAYKVELIKSKNDISGTYAGGTDSPRFGWGIDGTRTGTISESLQHLYTLVDTLGTHPEIQADLMPILGILIETTRADHIYRHLYHLGKGLDRVLAAKTYIEDNGERLSEHVQDVLGYLLPANVFMEQTTIDTLGSMGNYTVGTGFVDDAVIDTAQYGNHNLVVENTTGGVVTSNITLRVTCEDIVGASSFHDVSFTAGEADGVQKDVGTHGTNMYVDVTDITLQAGGGGTDSFDVYPEEERDVQPSWWT